MSFLAALTMLFSSHASAEVLAFTSDDWCPYICTKGDTPNSIENGDGLLVDILKRTFEPKGHKVSITIAPWARAIKDVRNGRYLAALGAFKSEVPDFVFPKKPVGISQMCFYTKKGHSWRYKGVSSLAKVKLGVIKGYNYDSGKIDEYISSQNDQDNIHVLTGTTSFHQILKMVQKDRLDAAIDDVNVTNYILHKSNFKTGFQQAGCLKGSELHIAFSPVLSESEYYSKVLSDSISTLRRSGDLKLMLDNYGLDDWEK